MADAVNSLSMNCLAEPASIPRARQALTDFAVAAGADPRRAQDVRLASSEALTNAVRHAYHHGRPGSVYVNADVACDELWILIADDGCGMEPRADRPGLGLGLGLIAQLSDYFAVAPRATGGTEVRMRFNLVGQERGSASSACSPASWRFSTIT